MMNKNKKRQSHSSAVDYKKEIEPYISWQQSQAGT